MPERERERASERERDEIITVSSNPPAVNYTHIPTNVQKSHTKHPPNVELKCSDGAKTRSIKSPPNL